MEDKLCEDVKMTLVYIAGYISSNDAGDEGASLFITKNMERMWKIWIGEAWKCQITPVANGQFCST